MTEKDYPDLMKLRNMVAELDELTAEGLRHLGDALAALTSRVGKLEKVVIGEEVPEPEPRRLATQMEFKRERHPCAVLLVAPPRKVNGVERGSLNNTNVKAAKGRGIEARLEGARDEFGRVVKAKFLGDIPSMPSPGTWLLLVDVFLRGEDRWSLIRESATAEKVHKWTPPDQVELCEDEYYVVHAMKGAAGHTTVHWVKSAPGPEKPERVEL